MRLFTKKLFLWGILFFATYGLKSATHVIRAIVSRDPYHLIKPHNTIFCPITLIDKADEINNFMKENVFTRDSDFMRNFIGEAEDNAEMLERFVEKCMNFFFLNTPYFSLFEDHQSIEAKTFLCRYSPSEYSASSSFHYGRPIKPPSENIEGRTSLLLHFAAWTDNTTLACALLRYGADVNAYRIHYEIYSREKTKYTALDCAVAQGSVEMVKLLLAAGARISRGRMEGDRCVTPHILHLVASMQENALYYQRDLHNLFLNDAITVDVNIDNAFRKILSTLISAGVNINEDVVIPSMDGHYTKSFLECLVGGFNTVEQAKIALDAGANPNGFIERKLYYFYYMPEEEVSTLIQHLLVAGVEPAQMEAKFLEDLREGKYLDCTPKIKKIITILHNNLCWNRRGPAVAAWHRARRRAPARLSPDSLLRQPTPAAETVSVRECTRSKYDKRPPA